MASNGAYNVLYCIIIIISGTDMENNMITIYTTDTCPRCAVLKSKLQSKNIEYQENHDMKEMKKLGIMSVPYVLLESGELMDFSEAVSWVNSL